MSEEKTESQPTQSRKRPGPIFYEKGTMEAREILDAFDKAGPEKQSIKRLDEAAPRTYFIGQSVFDLKLLLFAATGGLGPKKGAWWLCKCGVVIQFDLYRIADGYTRACGRPECGFTERRKEESEKAKEAILAKRAANKKPTNGAVVTPQEPVVPESQQAVPVAEPLAPVTQAQPEPQPPVAEVPVIEEPTKQPDLPYTPSAVSQPKTATAKTISDDCDRLGKRYAAWRRISEVDVIVALERIVGALKWRCVLYDEKEPAVNRIEGYSAFPQMALYEAEAKLKHFAIQDIRQAQLREIDLAWAKEGVSQ